MSISTPKTQIVLISGGNTGIGLAVVRSIAKNYPNYHIIIGSRNVAAGQAAAASISSTDLAASSSVSSVQLDITSDESITAATQHISSVHGHLDVLINNAAILIDGQYNGKKEPVPTRELFHKTFSTNMIGSACLTDACLPLLKKSSRPRIIFISSRIGSVAEATNKDMPFYDLDTKAYDSSKAAVNMLTLNYARILDNFDGKGGIAQVNCVCPGLVNTKLIAFNENGTSPEVEAERIVHLATLREGNVTASFSDKGWQYTVVTLLRINNCFIRVFPYQCGTSDHMVSVDMSISSWLDISFIA